jgi:signal transduction histidine kinase
VGRSVTLVWPPTGLALAALVLGGRALWPGVAAGAFVANFTTAGVDPFTSAGIAAGNTLEAVVGVTLLLRDRFHPQLDRTRDVIRFVAWGAVLGTSVSATIGSLTLWAGRFVPPSALFDTWRVWWVGDAMGALVVAPALLTWGSRPDEAERRPRWEAAALIATLLVTAAGTLTQPHETRRYLIFPTLIWAALRFGPRGASAATLLISIVTVGATVVGRGVFVAASLGEGLMALHAFLTSVALTGLALGTTAAERARAIRAREHFISIASHELRTPLAPLRLQVQRVLRALRRRPDAMPADAIVDALEVVDRQAERLAGLLESVLDVTRLRIGRLPLKLEAVDLGAIVDEIAATQREPLAQSGCTLTVERRGRLQGQWDRGRLTQVLSNLVVNAMKHGGAGPIEISLEGGDAQVAAVVRDHGPGVPRGAEDRIFRRFEHASAPSEVRGMGLGLYIAREIIEAHGGRIRVQSPAGGGAAFRIELPTGVPQR